MSASTTDQLQTFTLDQVSEIAIFYREFGFAVIKSVFSQEEIARAHESTNRIKAMVESGEIIKRGNVWPFVDGESAQARTCFWLSMYDDYLDQMRTDQRVLQVLKPLIGENIKQLTNQCHWKPPGTKISVNFHTDRINRKPDEHFREVGNSFVQLAVAIDPMTPDNGPLLVVPGSHKSIYEMNLGGANYNNGHPSRDMLTERGYTEADLMPVIIEAGDVALWHPDTIHGSDQNTSDRDRCIYINGYIKASSTWRGNWAFLKGQSIPVPPIDVPAPVYADSLDEDWQEHFPLGA